MIVNTEQLSLAEKHDLVYALARDLCGPITDPGGGAGCFLPLACDVGADCVASAQTLCHAPFYPERLVILEPTIEQIDVEQIPGEIVITGSWWRREQRTVAARAIEHKKVIVVPRGAFSVANVYIGNRPQFPTYRGDIGGDALGFNTELRLDGKKCEPNMCITVQVRHHLRRAVPFRALVLGRSVESKLRAA